MYLILGTGRHKVSGCELWEFTYTTGATCSNLLQKPINEHLNLHHLTWYPDSASAGFQDTDIATHHTVFASIHAQAAAFRAFRVQGSTVAHIFKPLLVVGVLGCVSTYRILNCPVVCVKHVDEAKAATHFDGAVTGTLVGALGFISITLGFCIRTETLGAHC